MKQSKVTPIQSAKAYSDKIIQFPTPKKLTWKKIIGFFNILLKGFIKASVFFIRYLLLAILMMFRKPIHLVFGFLASPLLYLR